MNNRNFPYTNMNSGRNSGRQSHIKVTEEFDSGSLGSNQYCGTVTPTSGIRKNFAVWIIIILLVVGLLLYLFKPSWVLKRDNAGNIIPCVNTPNAIRCEVDWGKLILWTIGITIAIVLILWLISSATKA